MSNLERARRRRLELESAAAVAAVISTIDPSPPQSPRIKEWQPPPSPPAPPASLLELSPRKLPPHAAAAFASALAAATTQARSAAADAEARAAKDVAFEEAITRAAAAENEVAELKRAATRAGAVAASEAEARRQAEIRLQAAVMRANAIEANAQVVASQMEADASSERRAAAKLRRELEAGQRVLGDAVSRAEAELKDALARAATAERAAASAAAAAVEAVHLAKEEGATALLKQRTELEEHCTAAEAEVDTLRAEVEALMVAQQQQVERTHAAKAALRDAATEPIVSLLLEQEAEAARIQSLLHELRNLSASLEESERKYEKLVRRTGRVLGRAAGPSSDTDEADSDDGATEGSAGEGRAGEGGNGRLGLRGRRAGRKPQEPERQHAVAAAMLTWYVHTLGQGRRRRAAAYMRQAAATRPAGVPPVAPFLSTLPSFASSKLRR